MNTICRVLARPVFPAGLVVVLLASCRDGNPPGVEGGRGDPAHATSEGEVQVDSLPRLDIAEAAGGQDVITGLVVSATRLRNGKIMAVDQLGALVLLYATDGTLLRTAGGKGDGPGELRMPNWIGQCGPGMVHVWDARNTRMSVYDTLGQFVRAFRMAVTPWRVRCNGSGKFVLLTFGHGLGGRPVADGPLNYSELLVQDEDGTVAFQRDSIPSARNRPLTALLSHAVSGNVIYYGFGETDSIHAMDMSGSSLSGVQLDIGPRPVTQAHYEAAIDRQVSSLRRSEERKRASAVLFEVPPPHTLPQFRAIDVDPAGNLWVTTSALGDGRTEIRVFAATSRLIGAVMLPHDVELHEIGRDYLLGTFVDGGGAQHLVLYGYTIR